MTFNLNPMQRKHRLDADGYHYVYIVKPRQFGFTTDYVIDMLDDALWVPGSSSAILAHDRETLGKIFQIIKRAYENLPEQLKPRTRYDTRNEYKFEQRYDGVLLDNEIYVALKLRGTTVQRLHVSEAAHVKDRDELKMGAKQAIPIGGRITEETTGNGLNEFYDDVMASIEKEQSGQPLTPQDYKVCFYAWFENPEYTLPGTLPEPDKIKYGDEAKLKETYNITDGQLLWRRWKLDEFRTSSEATAGLNVFQRFKQEYPATLLEAFQSGSGNVFDLDMLMNLNGSTPIHIQTIMDTVFPEAMGNIRTKLENLVIAGLKVWHLPEFNKQYVIGVDPSDGEGSDNTCIDVWEKPLNSGDTQQKMVQVAQYYGKIRPDKGAELCKTIAEAYNDAFVGVENNMLSFILFFSKIYDNYFMTVQIDEKTLKRTTKLGFSTNNKTRDPMIDDFRALFEDGMLEVNSNTTASEMKTFVKKDNGKREHADGKHDDALFGGFIAIQMRKYEPRRARVFEGKPRGF